MLRLVAPILSLYKPPLNVVLGGVETLSPTDVLVAQIIEYLTEYDIIDWANDYASSHPELESESTLFEILRLNRKRKDEVAKVPELLCRFVSQHEPDFDSHSAIAEDRARQLFNARLKDYLDEQCTPWAVCKMISPIEQHYDFPSWLGNMYNACDWIEPTMTPVNCRHLEIEIKEHLIAFDHTS